MNIQRAGEALWNNHAQNRSWEELTQLEQDQVVSEARLVVEAALEGEQCGDYPAPCNHEPAHGAIREQALDVRQATAAFHELVEAGKLTARSSAWDAFWTGWQVALQPETPAETWHAHQSAFPIKDIDTTGFQ